VEHFVDPDWTEVLSIERVKYYIYEKDSESGELVRKPYGPFPMRLEQHATKSSNRRMVLRDPNAGRVRLNLAMVVGMPNKVSKIVSKRTGKTQGNVSLMGIRDASKGAEQIIFVTAEEHFDKFAAKITEWTKS
jgi:hypothetical protein